MVSRRLRKKLMVTIISLLSCIAIMAVGVYAAQQNFSVQVNNKIEIEILSVNGTLSGKRVGDAVLGGISMGDEGIAALSGENAPIKTYQDEDVYGEIPEFIVLYSNEGTGYKENEENMALIKAPVNFYLSAEEKDEFGVSTGVKKDKLTIAYVFKFEFFAESYSNVNIALTNNTTQLLANDDRADKITETFLYCFDTEEPGVWEESSTIKSFGISGHNGGTYSIKVEGEHQGTHVVYIYAALTLERTNTLEDAYYLGIDGEEFIWGFSLSLTPEARTNN